MYVTYILEYLEHESHGLVEGLCAHVAPSGGVQLDAHVDVYEVVPVLSGTEARIATRRLHTYIHEYIHTRNSRPWTM
jgi:hypothetical protein